MCKTREEWILLRGLRGIILEEVEEFCYLSSTTTKIVLFYGMSFVSNNLYYKSKWEYVKLFQN